MKNSLFSIVCEAAIALAVASCTDNSPVGTAVRQYKAGEITQDSMLSFFGDSANLKPAIDWAEKHKADDDFAEYILGRAYKFGLGTDRDPVKSKAYYIASANKGNVNAMLGVAQLYAGYPGHEDLDSAYFWSDKAAKTGNGEAYFFLSLLETDKARVKGIPVDTSKIVDYLQKGVKLNDSQCLSGLASLYYLGQGVKQDKKKAFNMLSLADQSKLSPDGLALLGEMYELGEVTQQNFNAAVKYYTEAASKDNAYAICKMGNFYQLGQGVEKNDSLAFIQYSKAANVGNAWAQRCVAICFLEGTGVEKNNANAIQWFKTAAKNGDPEAIKFCKERRIED